MNTPLVSVNMIAFNVEKYISESIQSIIDQTYKNWELIIVDDGSSDNTWDIIQQFAKQDSRIKPYTNILNEGIVYSRNRAVHYSEGKYLAVLDSDDISLPDRLEKQVMFMENNESFGLIGSAFLIMDENGDTTGRGELNAKSEFFPALLLFNNFFLHSSTMMKSKLVKDILYKPLLKGFSPCEEYQLYVQISKTHKIWNLPDYLVKYREHDTGISKTRIDKIDYYRDIIICSLLNNIHINPNPEELLLHKSIRFAYEGLSIKQIEDIKNWILLLIKHNRKFCIYDISFEHYLIRRFWEICKFNARLGYPVLYKFIFSPFIFSSEISYQEILFLVRRCRWK